VKYIRHIIEIMAFWSMVWCATSCNRIDDNRIPSVGVQIVFTDVAVWNQYGVGGAMQYRYFVRQLNEPKGFFYSATTYTGFGGVLLVDDAYGNPMAYDMACPVECRADVRVAIDKDKNVAECPVCHSTYDVFSNLGSPLSGKAADKGYGLRRYNVYLTGASPYCVIGM